MSATPNRPQVILMGDMLEIVIVDENGMFKALPGTQAIQVPLGWRAALQAHAEQQIKSSS